MPAIRTKQCEKCPWRVDVDPTDIPNGYTPEKHAALQSTIATDGGYSTALSRELPMMACHEHPKSGETPCVGWMHNQIGPGNNIGLRMWLSRQYRDGKITGKLKLIGKQHERFEDFLPQGVE